MFACLAFYAAGIGGGVEGECLLLMFLGCNDPGMCFVSPWFPVSALVYLFFREY